MDRIGCFKLLLYLFGKVPVGDPGDYVFSLVPLASPGPLRHLMRKNRYAVLSCIL